MAVCQRVSKSDAEAHLCPIGPQASCTMGRTHGGVKTLGLPVAIHGIAWPVWLDCQAAVDVFRQFGNDARVSLAEAEVVEHPSRVWWNNARAGRSDEPYKLENLQARKPAENLWW